MINSFEGKYEFLSNFSPYPVSYKGVMYRTSEHAFQAAKAVTQQDHDWIMNQPSPGDAKHAGSPKGHKKRKIKIRSDWDEVKIDIMLQILREKFRLPKLQNKLLATGNQELVEGNWWGDNYWGVFQGIGENHLGKLLMQVREEYSSINTPTEIKSPKSTNAIAGETVLYGPTHKQRGVKE